MSLSEECIGNDFTMKYYKEKVFHYSDVKEAVKKLKKSWDTSQSGSEGESLNWLLDFPALLEKIFGEELTP